MKKIRIITLLSSLILLAACDASSGVAPTFAKEGEETTYANFMNQYSNVKSESELFDTSLSLSDRSQKISYYDSTLTIVKRGNSEIQKTESTMSAKGEIQFDYDNFTAKTEADSKSVDKLTSPDETRTNTSTEKINYIYQYSKKNSVSGLYSFNLKTKECSLYSSGTSSKSHFDSFVRNQTSGMTYWFEKYLPLDTKVQKQYLYYINNETQFTYIYNLDKTEKQAGSNVTTRLKIKAQVELADKKQKVLLSLEETLTTTYTAKSGIYVAGDVVTTETKEYRDYSITSKDYNISKIDDSDYTNISY